MMRLPKGKSGVNEYTHMLALEKQEKIVPELIAYRKASIPLGVRYYWNEFLELSRRRGFDSMSGNPLPLTWQDISGYCACLGKHLNTVEMQVITSCDEVYLDAWRKLHPPSTGSKTPKSARR